jgi:cystathionine beta-lyase
MTRFDTKLAHLGRASAHAARAVNPPLTRASTILFDSLDDLRAARADTPYETPRYGIYGTSTQFELQSAMAELCGTESCIATGSGLTAIAATLSAHATPGTRVLLQDGVYEPTRIFAEQELADVVDLRFFGTVDELDSLVTEDTSLVFIEVPTSGTIRLIDVRRAAEIAHRAGAPLACDSTWGTPRFFDAHALGVDISIHAGTKYIGGHSDIMLGLTTGTYDALEQTRRWCVHHGSATAPDVCWLGLRGLRTLSVRLERHQASALEVAGWLEQRLQVERVLFPALPSDPDHGALAGPVQRRSRPLQHRAGAVRRGRVCALHRVARALRAGGQLGRLREPRAAGHPACSPRPSSPARRWPPRSPAHRARGSGRSHRRPRAGTDTDVRVLMCSPQVTPARAPRGRSLA